MLKPQVLDRDGGQIGKGASLDLYKAKIKRPVNDDKENSKVRVGAGAEPLPSTTTKPKTNGLGTSTTSTSATTTSTTSTTTTATATNVKKTTANIKVHGSKPKFRATGLTVDRKDFTTRPPFDTFWEYASERHAVEEKRRTGKSQPWSKKYVFQDYKFCSVFRVADRGSQFLINEVIEKGSQEEEELLFRVLLYSSFVRVETYQLLSNSLGPLSWKTYDHTKYSKVLMKAINSGYSIYTGAFQKFPPQFGHMHSHENHLALLEIMMSNDLLGQLQCCKYMADAFDVIYQFPGSGDFVAFQLLINLSYTPLVNFSENDFVIAGVGAVKGLKKCFAPADSVGGSEGELIRWMTETQDAHFERLGLEPAVLTDAKGEKRKMTLVDVEHTLCELHKYLRIVSGSGSGEGSGYGKRFTQRTSRLPRWPTFPRAWSDPARQRTKKKHGRSGTERAEKVFVVNKILDKSETDDGEVVYLVDWLGYPASSRSWEPEEVLLEDAPLAVEEFERGGSKEEGKENENESGSRKRKRP